MHSAHHGLVACLYHRAAAVTLRPRSHGHLQRQQAGLPEKAARRQRGTRKMMVRSADNCSLVVLVIIP